MPRHPLPKKSSAVTPIVQNTNVIILHIGVIWWRKPLTRKNMSYNRIHIPRQERKQIQSSPRVSQQVKQESTSHTKKRIIIWERASKRSVIKKDFPFFILRHFLRDGFRTDGETESSTTRISTRISAGKVDTIDSLWFLWIDLDNPGESFSSYPARWALPQETIWPSNYF